ncbi:MAG TPA: hypothetical protein VLD61_09590 [Methylomirabilota bacterium]|nr:hypothetical protein [Methylomirabilota bacterium]
MTNATLTDLRQKADAAWASLGRQISLVVTGALFECHWQDHARQLGKIRQAAGLPPAG